MKPSRPGTSALEAPPGRPRWALNKPKPLRRSSPARVGHGRQMFKASSLSLSSAPFWRLLVRRGHRHDAHGLSLTRVGFNLVEIPGFITHKFKAIFLVVVDVNGITAGTRDKADAFSSSWYDCDVPMRNFLLAPRRCQLE